MTCQTSFAVWVTFNTTNKNKNRNSNMFMQKEQQVDHGIPIWCLLDWLKLFSSHYIVLQLQLHSLLV